MTQASQQGAWSVSMSPEHVARAFPFHIACTPDLRILQTGPSIQRLYADVVPGKSLGDFFGLQRPEGELSASFLRANTHQLILLRHHHSPVLLRGQVLANEAEGSLLLLTSPWLTSPEELEEHHLNFDDFALCDPMMDLLQLSQLQISTNRDLHKLMDRLKTQREELRQANRRLEEQADENRKLALISSRTDNAVVLTDARGRCEWINEGFTRLTGYTLEEMRGKTPGSVLQGPETDKTTVACIREWIMAGQGFQAELLNYHKNGRKYWITLEVQPMRDGKGQITNFMAIESDITAQREANARLAMQYQAARTLTTQEDMAVALPLLLQIICKHLGWQLGVFWTFAVENERWHLHSKWAAPGVEIPSTFNLSLLELQGAQTAPSASQPSLRDPTDIWARRMNSPKANLGRGGLNSEGSFVIPIEVHGTLYGALEFQSNASISADEETLNTFSALGHQLAHFIHRTTAEAALSKSNILKQAILDGANYAIISSDPDGRVITFNKAAQRMLGYPAEAVLGSAHLLQFHDPAEVDALRKSLQATPGLKIRSQINALFHKATLGQPDEGRWTYIRNDGQRIPVTLSITALYDARRTITGFLCVAADITERLLWESRLREEKDLLETTLGTIDSAVITVRTDLSISILNSVAEKLLGQTQAKLAGRKITDVLVLEDTQGQRQEHKIEEVLRSGSSTGNTHSIDEIWNLIPETGRAICVVCGISPLMGHNGQAQGAVIVLRDVGAELESDRLKRDFVSAVSHELRTPLTSIQGFITTIQRDPDMPAETRKEFLQIVADQSSRLRSLVDDILEISRIESGRVQMEEETLNVADIAEAALLDVGAEIERRSHRIVKTIPAGLPSIIGDAGKLRSVFTNLLSNACKFTPDGGKLELTISTKDMEVCVAVADSGIGIPQAELSRIFDKFYRVHREGLQIQGTGLGLAIVNSIVSKHKGRLEVTSELNRGSLFKVFLPTAPTDAPTAQRPLSHAP